MFPRAVKLPKDNSFFLFGARGTGKTSLLEEQYPRSEALWIDLLDPKEERRFAGNPGLLSERISARDAKKNSWVVIDEVQKIPALLDVVHHEIESRGVLFALTGSSARKLRRGSANLLAGRAFVFSLHPLTAFEMASTFSLDHALQWGTLPRIFGLSRDSSRELFLDAYVHTYLREEITAEQLVRNIQPFRRFLEIASQASGTIINFSAIGRDIQVDVKTVQNYFSILEDTLLGAFLPAFSRSVRKQQLQAPKFYLFDCGVKRAIDETLRFTPLSSQERGPLFEQFIINEIRRLNDYFRAKFSLSYLATAGGLEIDLVLSRPREEHIFIEVKSSDTITKAHLAHLRSLQGDFPQCRYICLCRESHPRSVDGIEVMPWREGLENLFRVHESQHRRRR
jgi:predicted AAA+ superfamily ATPase